MTATNHYSQWSFDSSIRFTRWFDGTSGRFPSWIEPGAFVVPPTTSLGPYLLGAQIGEGGFGRVFECISQKAPGRPLALKVSDQHETWARELYFNSIIGHQRFAMNLHDSFALPEPTIVSGVLFCTVMERATSDLWWHIANRASPLSESQVIKAASRILEPLAAMHNSGVVHRDVTPMNIFVMDDGTMKLADFGIAAQAIDKRRVVATAWNPGWVPDGLERHNYWTPSLDCWQLGQVMAAMLRNEIASPIRQTHVRQLSCSDQMKEIIWRAISPNEAERFGNASEFREALKARTLVRDLIGSARPSSLKKRRIVFTGRLNGLERSEATLRAQRKGATVGSAVTYDTDYIVVGEQTAAWAAGSSGTKLLTAHRLNNSGARIRKMSETTFLRLIGMR